MKNYICINGTKSQITDEMLAVGVAAMHGFSKTAEMLKQPGDGEMEKLCENLDGVHLGLYDTKDRYAVGDVLKLFDADYRVIGIDHDVPNSITVRKEILLPPRRFHDGACEKGWKDSELRGWLNGEYYDDLPDALKSRIKPVTKKTHNRHGKLYTTTDNVFILSESELFGSAYWSKYEDGARYEYFDNRHKRIMLNEDGQPCWYWTRSMDEDYSATFCIVNTYGNAASTSASAATGRVAPCFTIA